MARPAGKIRFGRRELGWRAGALASSWASFWALGLLGCRASPRAAASAPRLDGRVSLWSWFDLPDDPRSRELSALAWDAAAGVLWAVQDKAPRVVGLVPDAALRSFRFGPSVDLAVSGPLDLEGLVVLPDGFVVSSEIGPRIFEVDRRGALRAELPVPARFARARENKSLESLALSPSGRWLFTTSEAALEPDGALATPDRGTCLRIVRMSRAGAVASEHAYATDPAREGGELGVADMTALGDDELFVLERGFTEREGNRVRIYRVTLDDRASCLGVPALARDAPVLDKRLVVDLAELPADGVPAARQPQPAPLLDNYEGIALGPRLPDGRASLLVVSDDNARAEQVARILVLALG